VRRLPICAHADRGIMRAGLIVRSSIDQLLSEHGLRCGRSSGFGANSGEILDVLEDVGSAITPYALKRAANGRLTPDYVLQPRAFAPSVRESRTSPRRSTVPETVLAGRRAFRNFRRLRRSRRSHGRGIPNGFGEAPDIGVLPGRAWSSHSRQPSGGMFAPPGE
jgi:hypothetical protein